MRSPLRDATPPGKGVPRHQLRPPHQCHRDGRDRPARSDRRV